MNHEDAQHYARGANHRAESSGQPWIEPDEAMRALLGLAREHPRFALALALGAGFVVGGGLTPRLLLSVAVVAARGQARQWFVDMVQEAIRQPFEAPPDAAERGAPRP